MTGTEGEKSLFIPKDKRKLQRLEERLGNAGATCKIDLLAAIHDFEPGDEIIFLAKKADVVTLELTRNVVKAGLSGEKTELFDKNIFWKQTIESLRDKAEGKLIRGIEVNQTVRNAWKRFSLHFDNPTLAPSMLTIEVKDLKTEDLKYLLPKEDIEKFRKYNWLISDNLETSFRSMFLAHLEIHSMNDRGEKMHDVWPRPLSNDLYLASYIRPAALAKMRQTDRRSITFMKTPDESLMIAKSLLLQKLKDLPINLTDNEKEWITMNAIQTFLLSHAELKDAQEILYNTYQFSMEALKNKKDIRVLHIGGAHHSGTIKNLLDTNINNSEAINTSIVNDPRFSMPLNNGDLFMFFEEAIPIKNLLRGVKTEGLETIVEPQHIVSSVQKSILENQPEFEKRVLINRVLTTVDQQESSLTKSREYYLKQYELNRLDIELLRELCRGQKT